MNLEIVIWRKVDDTETVIDNLKDYKERLNSQGWNVGNFVVIE